MSTYFNKVLLDPRLNACNAEIFWSSLINTWTLWVSDNISSCSDSRKKNVSVTIWTNKHVEHCKPYGKNYWSELTWELRLYYHINLLTYLNNQDKIYYYWLSSFYRFFSSKTLTPCIWAFLELLKNGAGAQRYPP